MSAAIKDDGEEVMLCASCGTAEGDDIKLKRCTACYLVRYCSVKCQKEHRSQHKKECKKRATELHDEILFKQPESSHLGDCPICCLPVPLDTSKYCLNTCCCKEICQGCNIANVKRELEGRIQHKCPFCRITMPTTQEQSDELLMKRIEVNDPVAMCQMGMDKYDEDDYNAAFEYFTRAASWGVVQAHYRLSLMYLDGEGDVVKDKKRALHHAKKAAMGGHPDARHNLGLTELENGRVDRAVKHWIIAAKLGFDDSLENVKKLHKAGHASKDDFVEAIRGHKAAIDATKSPQREWAAAYHAKCFAGSRRGF